jgi:hypothetical protein
MMTRGMTRRGASFFQIELGRTIMMPTRPAHVILPGFILGQLLEGTRPSPRVRSSLDCTRLATPPPDKRKSGRNFLPRQA